jgi:PhoPQ-activated pathogenicity-related protein
MTRWLLLLGVSASAAPCASNYRVNGACVPEGVSPLEFYVQSFDPATGYAKRPMQTLEIRTEGGERATAYVLNLTSQRWMDDSIFAANSSANGLWHHQLSVVVPEACASQACGSTGWLYVTGGHNADGGGFTPLEASNGDLVQAAELGCATNTIGAVLMQVPVSATPLPEP